MMDVGAQLHAQPVLALGIVLNLVENIQRLPGGRALSDPRDLLYDGCRRAASRPTCPCAWNCAESRREHPTAAGRTCAFRSAGSAQAIAQRYRRWERGDLLSGVASDIKSWLSCDDQRTGLAGVLRHIDAHLSERLTTDGIARRFGYSRRRLSKVFQTHVGISAREYIARQRVRRACELLERGEKVEAAMLCVGYRNKTHFYRAFKKHAGCKPGAVRNPMTTEEADGRHAWLKVS